MERAILYTSNHKQTEGEPVILRRAKATAHILDHVNITIRDDELIAGNRTVKPRAGIISPEMDPYWLLKNWISSQVDHKIVLKSAKKINVFIVSSFTYWEKRSMKDFINDQMTDEVKTAVNTQILALTRRIKDRVTLLSTIHVC